MVSSTNYPEHYYNNDVCSTRITADPGKEIRIIFSDFQLEDKAEVNDKRQCVNDFLQIYDASYAKSDQLIGTFCGDVVPQPIRSSGRSCFFCFHRILGYLEWDIKQKYYLKTVGYPVKGFSSRAFRGGFIGKIRVPVYGVANNWRIEVTFRRRIYGLELMECDAKLADIPDNGADKMHFILDADKDDKKILHRGDKIEVEFIAKTFKRARDVKFETFFKPNHSDIL
ncbi:uncharacterized protein [Amphiura filiformis]|uniref:uncharacterized protein n=1 Tax=Amphiura filiformis TaxID=82378 RepID=UPI003B21055B